MSPPLTARREILWVSVVFTALAVCLAGAYRPALRAPYYLDDFRSIVDNHRTRLTSETAMSFGAAILGDSWITSRPLATLSYGLNRWAGGDDPAGFRLVNLGFHLGSAAILFLVLRLLSGPPPERKDGDTTAFRWFPLIVPLLWALNPVQIQAVTYIVQRMTVGMTFFFLGAMYAFFRGLGSQHPARWHLLAAFLGLLSFGFKLNAVLLPVFCALGYLLFREVPGLFQTSRSAVRATAVALAVTAVVGASLGIWAWKVAPPLASTYGFSWSERLLTGARIIPHYVGLFLLPLPSRLHLNYDVAVSTGIFSPPATALGILFLVAWGAGIALAWEKDRWMAFGLAWTLLGIVPESTVAPIDLVFEHRFYFPSIGLAIALCRAAQLAYGRLPEAAVRGWRVPAAVAVAALLLACGALTYARNGVWADPDRFWTHERKLAPGNPKVVLGSMVNHLEKKRYAYAIALGHKSLSETAMTGEDASNVMNNMALAFAGLKDWEGAVRILEESSRRFGERKFEVYNLGVANYHLGRREPAERLFRKVLAIDPDNPDAYFYLGLVLQSKSDHRAAASCFRNALRVKPGDIEALRKLEDSLAAAGSWAEAALVTDRLASAEGGHAEPRRMARAGYIYLQAGRIERAEAEWRGYLSRYPSDPDVNYNMACALSRKGDFAGALHFLERALSSGFRDKVVYSDPDLVSLRRDPRFLALMEKYPVRRAPDAKAG